MAISGSFRWLLPAVLVLFAGCQRFQSAESWLERGKASAARREYAEAALHYQKALQKRPGYAEAAFELGQVNLTLGRRPEAFQAYRLAAESRPDHLSYQAAFGDLALAAYLADESRPPALYRMVESAAQRTLARDANFLPALRWMGYLAATDLKPAQAEQWFRRALAIAPEAAELTEGLAQSLLAQSGRAGATEEAIRLLTELARRDPGRESAAAMLYTHYAGAGQWTAATQLLQDRAARLPNDPSAAAVLVRHHRHRGNRTEAEVALGQLRARGSEVPAALATAGELALEAGDTNLAEELFREGLRRHPAESGRYRRRLVTVYTLRRDTGQARPMVEALLRENPADAEMIAARALLQWHPADGASRKEAVRAFERLVRDYPDDIRYRYELGWVLRQTGDRKQAAARFEEVLARNPAHFLALASRAEMALEDGDPDRSRTYSDRILAIRPDDPGGLALRAEALLAEGRVGEVRPILARLQSQNPGSALARLLLARLELAQRRPAAADQALAPLRALRPPDPSVWRILLDLRLANQQAEPVLAEIQEFVTRYPDPAWRALAAFGLMSTGRYPEAIAAYQALVTEEPQTAEYHFRLGLLYQLTRQFPQAIASLKAAERLAPRNARVAAELGAALDQAGQPAAAESAFRRALALEPDAPLVLNNLADLLRRKGGAVPEAAQLARRAVDRDPATPEFQLTLAELLLAQGDREGARRILDPLVKKYPTAEAIRRLADQARRQPGTPDRSDARESAH